MTTVLTDNLNPDGILYVPLHLVGHYALGPNFITFLRIFEL